MTTLPILDTSNLGNCLTRVIFRDAYCDAFKKYNSYISKDNLAIKKVRKNEFTNLQYIEKIAKKKL